MPGDDKKISDKELSQWIKQVEAKPPMRNRAERRPKVPDKKAAQPSPPPDEQHSSQSPDSEAPATD
jgi:hypothetical protein